MKQNWATWATDKSETAINTLSNNETLKSCAWRNIFIVIFTAAHPWSNGTNQMRPLIRGFLHFFNPDVLLAPALCHSSFHIHSIQFQIRRGL